MLLLLLLPAAFLLPPWLTAPAPAPTPEANRKALNTVFNDYWEDRLKHDPEFASSIGDKRYNDQIDDHSVKAVNDQLEREQTLLLRLAAIDVTGLSDQEKISQALLLRQFTERSGSRSLQRNGRCPSTSAAASISIYPQLAAQLTFPTVKDYVTTGSPASHAMFPTPLTRCPPAQWPSASRTIAYRQSSCSKKHARKNGGQHAGPREAGGLAAGSAAQEVSGHDPRPRSRSASSPKCSTPSAKKSFPPICDSRAFSRSATFPAGRLTRSASPALPDGKKSITSF